jgi:hypothetical protein
MPALWYKNKKAPLLYCFFCFVVQLNPSMQFQQIKGAGPIGVTGLLLAANVCFSQTIDSIPKRDSLPGKAIAQVTDRFPSTRMLLLEYSQLAPYRYTANPSNALSKNKVSNQSMVKATVNLSFVRKQKWMLGATINYRYLAATAETVGIPAANTGTTKEGFHYQNTSINALYFSKLFGKMAIYSGSLIVDGSDQYFERLKGRLSATLLLKANAQTKIMAGVAVTIDPSTQIPVLPIFSYEHRFANGLRADILLPQRIMVKKDVFRNGRLSLGAEMGQNSFYLYHSDSTSQKYEFRQTELNSGFTYEQLIGKSMSTFIKTGMKTSLNARKFLKSEAVNDYVLEAKPNATFYVTAGLSINPFSKPRKK